MGNESTKGVSSLPHDVINALRKNTPFTSIEADQILRRYGMMDKSSNGEDGITIDDCMMMPEFTGCAFAPDVIQYYKDSKTKNIHPRQFMKICTMLCRRTPALKKKEFLFDLFDVDKQKVLTHDAMFRIYRLLFQTAISDDHILALVFSALRHPNLAKDGEISRDEFVDMIPDVEIQERLSVDFAFDPSFVPDEPEEDEDEDEDYA